MPGLDPGEGAAWIGDGVGSGEGRATGSGVATGLGVANGAGVDVGTGLAVANGLVIGKGKKGSPVGEGLALGLTAPPAPPLTGSGVGGGTVHAPGPEPKLPRSSACASACARSRRAWAASSPHPASDSPLICANPLR
ncbi:MAG TPA: hypothetical protein VIM86_02890, partial [Thermodesulfobacteriota bacterium]